uniref:G protein-coupled receptor n=1 Tax=Panagrellus redivivus TaxID=6233 RepID=A0A7E4WDY2_PANRE
MDGVAKNLPQPWRFLAFDLWLFTIAFSMTSVPIEFMYRYSLIVKNSEFTLFKQLFCVAISCIVSLLFAFVCYLMYYHYSSPYLHLAQSYAWLLGDENGIVWVAGMALPYRENYFLVGGIIVIILVTLGSYVIIVYCNFRTYIHMRRQTGLSAKTSEVQTDMGRLLSIQAFIPMASSAAPSALLIFALIFDNVSIVSGTSFVTMFYSWLAPGNAFFILFFLKAYRRRFIRIVLSRMPFVMVRNGDLASTSTTFSKIKTRTSRTIRKLSVVSAR